MKPEKLDPKVLLHDLREAIYEDRAQEAVRRMRRMLPGLRAFARALTRDPKVDIVLAPGTPCTDGRTIWLRPLIELGDLTPHDLSKCGHRDERGVQLCTAHRIIDEVETTLYHEIAHIAYDSFESLADTDRLEIITRALDEAGKADDTTRAAKIARQLEMVKPDNYMTAARMVSPYMPTLVNALEDARVNTEMYRARPGTYKRFKAHATRVFEEGNETDDGEVQLWADAPPNIQVIVGLYAKAAGYDYSGWFSEQVTAALDDPHLSREVAKVATARSTKSIYRMAFPVLEHLRRLGFCKRIEDIEDDPPVGSQGGEKGERPDNDDAPPSPPSVPEEGDPPPQQREVAGDDDPDGADGDGETGDEDDGEHDAGDSDSEDAERADGTDGDDHAAEDPDGVEDDDQGSYDDDQGDDATGDHADDDDDDFASGSDDDHADDDFDDDDEDDDWADDDDDEDYEDEDDADGSDGERDSDADDDREDRSGFSGEGADGEPDEDADTEDGETGGDDGSAEDAERALRNFGGHAEKTGTYEDFANNLEIDRAIVQGECFDEPSRTLFGVNVHRWNNRDERAELAGWRPDMIHYNGEDIGLHMTADESIVLPALARARVVFSENRQARKVRNLRSGRISVRALGKRVPVGDDRIFAKKLEPGKRDYFVVIGLDNSGSTSGDDCLNLKVIKESGLAMAELLNRLGVKFAVYAHNGRAHDKRDHFKRTSGTVLDLDIVALKEPEESWGPEQRERLRHLTPSGYNLDGHAMEFYRKVTDGQRATDKLIMYFTDGEMPMANYHDELAVLQREIKQAKRRNLTIVGVGIGTDSPKQHGLDTIQLNEVGDVPRVVADLESRLTS